MNPKISVLPAAQENADPPAPVPVLMEANVPFCQPLPVPITATVEPPDTVIADVPVLDVLATDVAVNVTKAGEGTLAGAV